MVKPSNDEILRIASEAERLQKNQYFAGLVKRLEDEANEELTNLSSENTEKFIALAQMKEFLRVLTRTVGADVHRGKVVRERAGKKKRG